MHIVDGKTVIEWLDRHWPAVGLTALFVAGVGLLWPLLPPFLLGAFWAYCCHPLACWGQARGISRTVSALILALVVYGVLILAWVVLIPFCKDFSLQVTQQLPTYRGTLMRALEPMIRHGFASLGPKVQSYVDGALTLAAQWVGFSLRGLLVYMAHNARMLVQAVLVLLLSPIVAFHLLKDTSKIQDWLRRRLSQTQRHYVRGLGTLLNQALGGYVRGQALVCTVMAVYYGAGLSVCGIDGALALGVFTGVALWVPYLGFACSLLMACLMALFQDFSLGALGWVLMIYGIGQVLEGIFLTPLLVGRRTGVHPLWVLFSVMVGGFFKGVAGVFLALPVAAVVTAVWRLMDRHWVLPQAQDPVCLPAQPTHSTLK